MNVVASIREALDAINYDFKNDVYFIFMYVTNVYTGKISKDGILAYTDKESELPKDDSLFLEGYAFNEDVQINLDREDGIDVVKQDDIDKLHLDKIEEDMFVLSDGKTTECAESYTKLTQGKKSVVIPKKFAQGDVNKGITLKVVNYIDYDKNDFPFVRYARFMGFDSYKERG